MWFFSVRPAEIGVLIPDILLWASHFATLISLANNGSAGGLVWTGICLTLNQRMGQHEHSVRGQEPGLCAGPSEAAPEYPMCIDEGSPVLTKSYVVPWDQVY